MLKRRAFTLLSVLVLLLIGLLVFASVSRAQAGRQSFNPVSTPQGISPAADSCGYEWQGQHSMPNMGRHGWDMQGNEDQYGGCTYNHQQGWNMPPERMQNWRMMPGHPNRSATPAPAATVPPPTTAPVSFKADVQPIFQARCVNCHGGTAGLSLNSYRNVMHGGVHGPVIVPGNPAGSSLIQRVSNGAMPASGPRLTTAQIQTLVNWVAAGAPNN